MVAGTSPSTAIRARNLRAVLEALRDRRPVARADVAVGTGLSKPTVGGALRSLEAAGVVREYGRTTGRRGPSASLYALVPDAVLVLGVDVGARYVNAEVTDLDGRVVQAERLPLRRPAASDLLAAVRQVAERVAALASRIEVAVVGTPGVVDPVSGRVGAAPNIEDWDGVVAERVLSDALGLPVQVENDVNLAALGERTMGAGRDVDSFAYLKVGSGVGAGMVLHGRLHRGGRGAAGEVGFLPVGPDPFAACGSGGAMEDQLSSRALTRRAEELAATTATRRRPPFEVAALFDAARAGDPLGRAVARHAARQLALAVAGITAVVDLDLVLVGGGIGVNGDLLLPDARADLALLVPAPPRVDAAMLGDGAVLAGAASVGREAATDAVLRRLLASPA